MCVLVTGGTSFTGSNPALRTLATRPDVNVTVLDALIYAANPANLEGTDCEITRNDVHDAELIDRPVPHFDAIVHFAAESRNDNSLVDANPFITTSVLGAMNLAKVRTTHEVHLHYISTDEVFGNLALDDPARFMMAIVYKPPSPYSASKVSANHFARAWVHSLRLAATIGNCLNNYGPRQYPEKLIPQQICGPLRGRSPRAYGTGEDVRGWIHVDDYNDAVWVALGASEVGETYLTGTGGKCSNLDVVGDILEGFGRARPDFVHVTDRPGHNRRCAIDPASIRILGWQPRYQDFSFGPAETIDWYRANEF